ncbi:MAG: hypothetical protein B6D35_08065 [Candidatus Brocadia sp. UTAMX2]|jgi:DNA sulfur modification protein DndC|nr:MAG: hypothetical protein B6D35_08065 [Candidatus Brocadia sp. UTAMX2]
MGHINKLKEVEAIIKRHYLSPDERPWIIGFSGGKDSTTLLQMVFHVLTNIPPKKRRRMVYVLSADTLLEPPNISTYLNKTVSQIEKSAHSLNLPMQVEVVKPNPNDTFFLRLIGYGYPAPNKWFRWCTDRLKIRPANRFIKTKISLHGSVILLLGSRMAESSERAKSIKKHYKDVAEDFSPHTSLINAFVFSPIKNLKTDEVWMYLLQTPCPWGGDNSELVAMYKDANSGECPLVVDDSTPPCGNSRFGCWVCTVVERDRSMEGFVEAGYANYEYLLEFRNWLHELRDNEQMREKKKRNGAAGLGPFRLEVRKEILERLLNIQKLLGEELISKKEVGEIKKIWIADNLSSSRRVAMVK